MAIGLSGFAPCISFAVSLATTEAMRAFALRSGLLDQPTARSSHTTATPRGGGVAIVGAFLVGLCVLYLAGRVDASLVMLFVVAGGTIALIGYVDDRRPLSARARFPVHLIACGIAVATIENSTSSAIEVWGSIGLWSMRLFGVITIVWATNLFNFMDGIDGLAAAEAVFIGGSGALLMWSFGGDVGLSLSLLCLAAASFGFLIWNWPPAKIFMGDVGSGFLGFSVAALGWLIGQKGLLPLQVWPILGGIFVVDATLTLLRRVVRGDRWFEAHRMHAYQHLSRRWRSHLSVTLAASAVNVLWLLPWAWFAAVNPRWATLALVIALAPLVVVAFRLGSGAPE